LSGLQFLADGFNVNLGKPLFESGLTLQEDFQIARVFQIPDQWSVGDHALEKATD
jgi:hypothetical protein